MNHAEDIPSPQGRFLRLFAAICLAATLICACHEEKRAAIPPPEVQIAEIIRKMSRSSMNGWAQPTGW